jgi:hypothetical protein
MPEADLNIFFEILLSFSAQIEWAKSSIGI